jgi:hypothetical protein
VVVVPDRFCQSPGDRDGDDPARILVVLKHKS